MKRFSRVLPEPVDFFEGLRGEHTLVPNNVLCFSRKRFADLQVGDRDYAHHRFVLIENRGASVTAVFHRRRYVLSGEMVAVLAPFTLHRFLEPVDSNGLSMTFVTFDLPGNFGLPPGPVAIVQSTRELTRELDHVIHSFRTCLPIPGCSLSEVDKIRAVNTMRLRLALVIELVLGIQAATGDSRIGEAPIRRTPIVDRAVDLITDNPGMTADQVAAEVGTSESRLRAQFQTHIHCSVRDQIRRTRINKARYLLATTSAPIGEVATDCGYASVYSFSRSFRNATGECPSRYRDHVFLGDGTHRESGSRGMEQSLW